VKTRSAIVLVTLISAVAAIAVPNFLNARDRGRQKRTMSDLRSIGTAIESYQVTNGFPVRQPSGAAAVELSRFLQPTFIRMLPAIDGWGSAFQWVRANPVRDDEYSVVSFGKNGTADALAGGGATTDFRQDLYFSDGQFTRFPEAT
jgi:type II secretory pathway pseudopilin PulG